MNKRLITAYSVFSFLVFLFLIVWFVFRTINTRTDNLLSARKDLENISRTVTSSYLTAGSFTSPYFSETVLKSIGDDEHLKALVISTDQGRLEFAYAVESRYLPGTLDFKALLTFPVSFSFNPITEEAVFTSSVVPSGKDIRLDAVYGIFERSEVFPVVRELLIGLLSFLLVTAIAIIVQPHLYAKHGTAAAAPGRQRATKDRAAPEEDAFGGSDALEADADPSGGLYSPSSALGFEQHLEERLSAELKRAASFDQDLVLLLGCVNGLERADPFYAELSRMAREFFNFQDLCFEYGNSGIGIIIPNVDIDQGIQRVEEFKDRVDKRIGEETDSRKLFIGLSARNGRLISGNRIIREAESALRRAEHESAGIMAFRVDPEKYRDYIASRKSSMRR
ncbi:MAG: hypothetical protein JW852_10025 [Spirochaetales bacterium]|nr:hypothetical protein [Spirochaetales bacterium]